MQVRWTMPAADDLRRIARYIRRDRPLAARNVAKTIFDAGNGLEIFPERGRKGRIPGTRELVFPGWPYILVYQVEEQTVEILRIYHGAQDWP
jgi:addiction module RelE/StbE family toxin